MTDNLIFDLGANDGSDTAFYLAKGFRVISVEADPALAEKLSTRFASEVASGQAIIENVGVSDQTGEATFYRNSFSEWSSLHPDTKAVSANSYEEVVVPLMTLSDLIVRHGAPYYIKLDIEGSELKAISTLSPSSSVPHYLSVEVNPDWPKIAEHLIPLGFDYVQLVRQGKGILQPPPVPPREGRIVDITFTNRHSGCFGKDLPDNWIAVSALTDLMDATWKETRARRDRGEKGGWHDIHFVRSSAL